MKEFHIYILFTRQLKHRFEEIKHIKYVKELYNENKKKTIYTFKEKGTGKYSVLVSQQSKYYGQVNFLYMYL